MQFACSLHLITTIAQALTSIGTNCILYLNKHNMLLKNVFTLLILSLFFTLPASAQKNDYKKNWDKVKQFQDKGLPKSALQEVIRIQNLALKENNDAQVVKTYMYEIMFRNQVEEESRENNIFYVDTLIDKAKGPAKNVLQSMQAEMFWSYLRENQWQIKNRTQLANEKAKDIRTWSMEKLYSTITALYKASLSNPQMLKSTPVAEFEPILIPGTNSRQLRPTLYDLLAFRALDYFVSDESYITKPAYQFKITDTIVFAPASEFVKASFVTKDTSSLERYALVLLQDIMKFHMNDAKPDPLIDADIIRLKFANDNAVMEDKVKLYEIALKNIEETYPDNPSIAEAMFLRATIYRERGAAYNPFTKKESQYEIKRAKELAEKAYAQFPKSIGGTSAANMVSDIQQPSLNTEIEKANVPGQPFRALVKYKNLKNLYFRIIKTSRAELKNLDRKDYDKLWKFYTEMKIQKSWSVSLPDLQDYQEHGVEVKIDGLPSGVYIILSSIDPYFSLTKNIIAKNIVHVSNISYIHNNSNEYYVLNRDNGQPLNNAQVQLWESVYNYQTYQYEEKKAEKYTSDKNGLFKVKSKDSYRYFLFQITYGDDELFMDESNYYSSYNSYKPEIKPQTTLFTDRSIYRPGQTVFFKGIVYQREIDAAKSKVLSGFNTKVILRDVNYQKVGSVDVVSNDYGSYKGNFKLPEGLLNGIFNIWDSVTNTVVYVSVEEYKRPKFVADIQKPKGTYRLNDSITVTGTAKAYAGNNIDGAKVKYRVVRKVRYPIWWEWWFYRGGFGGDNKEVEISNGETVTDQKGEFKVTFKALPDITVDKKSQPTFYYEVSVDITDINGETRSGSTSVAVAYQALQLSIGVNDKLQADSLKDLSISSKNLNNIFEKAKVTVTIDKLIPPTRIYRERYWGQPDQFMMSKEEYYNNFPYDIYSDEDKIQNWPIGDRVYWNVDSTKENDNWKIGGAEPGWYKIVATTKDKYGEDVRAEKYIQLTPGLGTVAKTNEPVSVTVNKYTYEPGEKIEYKISTGFDNIWMIHSMTKMNDVEKDDYVPFTSSSPFYNSIAVNEADRGGIAISYAFVMHNRVYKSNETFMVPWSNKMLSISYETFRDKLFPGSQEKWKLKVSGSKGEAVAAEMLLGMYDASLDQYRSHSWSGLNIWPGLYNSVSWSGVGFGSINSEEYNKRDYDYVTVPTKTYDALMNYLYQYEDYNYRGYAKSFGEFSPPPPPPAPTTAAQQKVVAASGIKKSVRIRGSRSLQDKDANGVVDEEDQTEVADSIGAVGGGKKKGTEDVQVRKNFNETAFFFPELQTDVAGNVSFSFTIPEALTKWKLMTFAHTKDLQSGYVEKSTVTQKVLMVQPNAPRFMREGDKMEFTVKIVNMADSEVTGNATLELIDVASNKSVDGWFKNVFPAQYFTIAAGQSFAMKFPMEIPFNFNSALMYRVKAITKANNKGETFSDGEEMAFPVLTNRMLVTESMPINMRGSTTTKNFKFTKLLNSSNSTTLSNHALTVEYTSNPAWYAVQALPYLMEYPYECAEQTFNRYYANTLASFISNSTPKIKIIFERWKNLDTAALMSNLEKNQELKSALLEETPWVLESQNENKQKKNIALLFDMIRMSNEQDRAMNKLKDLQSSNGGFVWFKDGPDDRYMTQYIITGIGHLKKLNALSSDSYQKVRNMVDKAVPYLDKKIKDDYDELIKWKVKLSDNNLSSIAIQYLYMRSFFPEYKIADASQTAYNYYRGQAKKYWLTNGKYMQAMIALALYRTDDKTTPLAIIKSLKENSISSEEMGMYWKEFNTGGYYWWQSPIESHAMMIEAFTDIDKDQNTIDDLKTWLLKQKQTQNWRTTKATSEACYALLIGGSNWLAEEKDVTISLGNTIIKSTDNKTEAGTGYFKTKIDGPNVSASMGNIDITVKPTTNPTGTSTSWGSVYWQYFEDLDKITPAATPLKLDKKLFIERNTDRGPELVALTDGATLKVGDKVKVRIELRVDRNMEYVHMKDMRAACMEPVNVISQYKYQDGLGYYESTKDASTNFFFSYLNKGTYVFEYPLFVTHAGDFSNGITTIQCMYAPEFTSHSECIRVNVE